MRRGGRGDGDPWTHDDALYDLEDEAKDAEDRFGPFTSTHEGYGVLAEEVAELLDAIRANDGAAIRLEAIQVGAVAFRIATSLRDAKTRERSGVE